MKVLYIAEQLSIASGGSVGNRRDRAVLKDYFGESNIVFFYVKAPQVFPLKKVWLELLYKNIFGINSSKSHEILDIIRKQNIKLIWLDSSNLGCIAKIIKEHFPQIKIITFFQNVEYNFMKDQWHLTHNPKFTYRIYLAKINEQYSCRFSDRIISLNTRDAQAIEHLYGRIPDIQIPVSLKDDVEPEQPIFSGNIKALFLGSNFPPNIEGIKLFIDHILPKISIDLVVAGSGMEVLKPQYPNTERLQIMGFVENLQKLYASVNFMVMPIFSGSGMKVKTAEALKYGKFIFASPEAIEGYKVTPKEVCVCRNIGEFIQQINDKANHIEPYNPSSRLLFKKYYSLDATKKIFETLFLSLGL